MASWELPLLMAAAVRATRLSRQPCHESGSGLLIARRADHGAAGQADRGVAGVAAGHTLVKGAGGRVDLVVATQIGRASCRERV